MQTIILCGGRGERLMPLTEKRPAALLRIAGRELILHVLEQVKKSGAQEAVLAIGYCSHQMKHFLETEAYGGMSIDFSNSESLGTASAIAHAFTDEDENAVIIEGNGIFDFDLKKAYEFHKKNNAMCTVITKKHISCKNNVFVRVDKNSHVTGYAVQPSGEAVGFDRCLTGIYIINKKMLNEYSFTDGTDFAADILSKAVENNETVLSWEEKGYWQKILYPRGFLECQKHMLEKMSDGLISETDSNFSGAAITGPVYIGSNVTIKSGAIIEKGSVIDDNAVIKRGARVKGSYVGVSSVISENSSIENAVVCSGAMLSKRVCCEEYSVIGENVIVGEEARIQSNVRIRADRKVCRSALVSSSVSVGQGKGFEIDEEGLCSLGGAVTPYLAAKFGMAAGSALDVGSFAVVGRSEKKGTEIFHMALVSGLLSCGVRVLDIGECTLSQLMFSTSKCAASLGIYSGVNLGRQFKVFERCGVPLNRKTESMIEENFSSMKFRSMASDKMHSPVSAQSEREFYLSYLKNILPKSLRGVNADIRTGDINLAKLSDEIFPERNDINGEKVIFHISQDGSQTAAYSEKTGYVSWERLAALGIKTAFEKGIKVSVPYTFPSSADIAAEENNGILYRYYNSSFDNSDYEARKNAMCSDNLFMRDGLMLACIICARMSAKKINLYTALKDIPEIHSVRRFIGFSGEPSVVLRKLTGTSSRVNEGTVYEGSGSRAIIRPLKHGNGLIIFSESFQSEQASAVCDEIAEEIKKIESFNQP